MELSSKQPTVQKQGFGIPLLKFWQNHFRLWVHIGALLPLGVLVWRFFTGNLTVNPIQAASQRTGDIALVMLLLSLACTPAASILGIKEAIRYRRTLGLYAFFYAALHFMIFVGLDYTFRWDLIWDTLIEKRFIVLGFSAGLILLTLAVTSFDWWKKRLRKNWKRLHRLVYLAGGLVVLHYFWAVKAGIQLPLLATWVLLGLLLIRVPTVKELLIDARYKLTRFIRS
jgi:methionine sulfoxide reductase heme-binding subunit